MAHSGKERHRDRDPRPRWTEDDTRPAGARTFRLTGAERQAIAESLRDIDGARQALELQHDARNHQIVRELRAAADAIFDVLSALEEID